MTRFEAKKLAMTYCDGKLKPHAERRDVELYKWTLRSKDLHALNGILSVQGCDRPIWCNEHVRAAASESMIDAFLDDFDADKSKKRYWLTFCWDDGVTYERRPVIDIVALKNKINMHLRNWGLEGVGVIEVDVQKNMTGEAGRRLNFHVHCYCWASGFAFNRIKAQNTLSNSRAFVNSLGARSVVIKNVTLNYRSVAHLAAYMTKLNNVAKNLVPSRKRPGRYAFRDASMPQGSMIRLAEVLSNLQLGDALFSVGEGKKIASRVRREVLAKLRSAPRTVNVPSKNAINRLWDRGRSGKRGPKLNHKCEIITRVSERKNF